MKAKVIQTFYIPRTGQHYKNGEMIDVDSTFAHEYAHCLNILEEKTAPAPLNKMVTPEKEVVKTKAVKKGKK